ncbi:trehalose operon repressor [Streptococcus oricebi]|uniref:Trehalose operon repressor n=1 Tax=Streptococcus oricebi TaxID=1547447 RepID=A0ABS5B3I5_9STRE|nr:trehalose operon repressor [Streptococcus oricebi]MBP2623384.1 trehalose operon repressor [Streptococcus oricebi]
MKKYQQLFKTIQEEILSEKYQVGDYLPSEHELSQTYQVSRSTVRKALALVEKIGLIEKIQGQGSKILKREQIDFPVSRLTSYRELIEQLGLPSTTKVIRFELLTVDQRLARITGFAPYRLVWRIIRQRLVDHTASVLDIDYIDKELVTGLNREIAEQSIYAYLENDLGLDITYARKEITIDHATDRDKIFLQLGNDQHVVSVKSQVYLADGQQFQYTESRHKLEKFRFVDFAHRHK